MEPLFLTAVRQSLSEWEALQQAIEHGMGGSEAREKELWMSQVIVDYFKEYPDLSPTEVADYVEEILDNEFQTEVKDGSLEVMGTVLCRYHSLWKNGDNDKLALRLETQRQDALKKREENQFRALSDRMQTLSVVPPRDQESPGIGIEARASSVNGFTVERSEEGAEDKEASRGPDAEGWIPVGRPKRKGQK
jgi:hypothetical protein